MSILIGLKTPGNIRYISVSPVYKSGFNKVIATLRTFYKTQERVKALIELGNLDWLGISPYKKCKGIDDTVNCESLIRDRKLSPGKHGAQFVPDEKEFVKKLTGTSRGNINCCFLYENSEWFILVGGHKESIRLTDESVLGKSALMDGLKVYRYEPENQYHKLSGESFLSWAEVKQSADEKQTVYYIFRGEKFLTIISPSVKQPEQAL
jgi:hypothetical protein